MADGHLRIRPLALMEAVHQAADAEHDLMISGEAMPLEEIDRLDVGGGEDQELIPLNGRDD